MTDIKRVFANNLTRLLSERNMSQGDLAKALGYNRTTINMWCIGKAFPTSDKIEVIAKYFNVGKSELLEEYGSVAYNESLLRRLMAYASKLSPEGILKLEERAEELAEVPKYKKEPPHRDGPSERS